MSKLGSQSSKSMCSSCKDLPEGEVIKGHDHRFPQDRIDKIYELYTKCHDEFSTQNGYIKGKLLTLVDAAFSDSQQRKAFKDLVSQELDRHFQQNIRELLIGFFNEACFLGTDFTLFPANGNHRNPKTL